MNLDRQSVKEYNWLGGSPGGLGLEREIQFYSPGVLEATISQCSYVVVCKYEGSAP